MKKHFKSRNPALNIPGRHEAVATDTVFSDTHAGDSGVKQAKVFIGRDTLVADAYPMKSGKQFVNTLEDNIRRREAIDKLLSDSGKTEHPIRIWIFLGHITFHIGILSPTTRIKPSLMEVQDYQILDQYSHEQIWCPSQLLALMPHLCVLSTYPHSLQCP